MYLGKTELKLKLTLNQTFHPIKVYIGSGSRVVTQSQTKVNSGLDSEFYSIHFGIENKERLKFLMINLKMEHCGAFYALFF